MNDELRKLDRWSAGEERRLRIEIDNVAERIRRIRGNLGRSIDENEREKFSGDLLREEKKLSKMRGKFFDAKARIKQDRLQLIGAAKERLELSYETEVLFEIRFSVV